MPNRIEYLQIQILFEVRIH